jgi:hypothetical protein
VLDDTDADISIYTLFNSKESNTVITRVEQVLDQYRLHDRKIHIENKELYLYPDFANKYATDDSTVDENSIIVESGDRYKVISYYDYVDSSTGDFQIEENLTSAIQYVTAEATSKVCFVTGHGEIDLSNLYTLESNLKLNNYATENVDLLSQDIPEDCTILFAIAGYKDYSKDEAQKVKDYLANGGRAFFITETAMSDNSSSVIPIRTGEQQYPNFYSILSSYGVKPAEGYVFEGDDSSYIMDTPAFIVPKANSHSITKKLIDNNYSTLATLAQPLTEVEATQMKQGLKIEELLGTSDKAYLKNEEATSMNKEDGDISGEFALAYAIEDTYDSDAKVVVTGSISFVLDYYDSYTNGSGNTFVMESIKWLDDNASSVSISAKNLNSDTISVTSDEKTKIQILSWGVIPGVLFIAGFIVWIRRRNG